MHAFGIFDYENSSLQVSIYMYTVYIFRFICAHDKNGLASDLTHQYVTSELFFDFDYRSLFRKPFICPIEARGMDARHSLAKISEYSDIPLKLLVSSYLL